MDDSANPPSSQPTTRGGRFASLRARVRALGRRFPSLPAPVRRHGRPIIGALLAALLLGGGVGAMVLADEPPARPVWRSAPVPAPISAALTPSAAPSADTAESISLSATGDIVMANPPRYPPNDGRGFFDDVKEALAADLVMGNLEEPLTDDTGYAKCARPSPSAAPSGCFQFRAPPSYAAYLRDGGFRLLNLANNHANDYGLAGHRNTQRALEQQGLAHTGDMDQITVVTVKGVRIAVLGFSSYSGTNSLLDLNQARRVIEAATARADLVVVQVHMGAEGSEATHVRPGTEIFLGENRGDPIRFAHTVIDAGADLVVGHGPHVMRALEFHKGRLIAYSLGNFAGGGGTLGSAGNLGLGAVLKVSLQRDGSWASGALIATTHQGSGGLPRRDPQRRGVALVRSLTAADFPTTGARLGPTGEITTPAA